MRAERAFAVLGHLIKTPAFEQQGLTTATTPNQKPLQKPEKGVCVWEKYSLHEVMKGKLHRQFAISAFKWEVICSEEGKLDPMVHGK